MDLGLRTAYLTLAASILAAPALQAQNINVSPIATNWRTLDWTEEANTIKVIPPANITYYQMGRVRVPADTSDYVGPAPWTAAWSNVPLYPYLSREFDTPPPTSQLTWASPYYSLGLVDMASSTRQIQSRTFSSGSARSAINYSVRVEHYGSTPLDYFVQLQHPKIQIGASPAYTLQPGGPGGGGGTYLYYSPDAARARGSVDVLVDGLPVWSSESTYMYPEGIASYPWDKKNNSWGNPLTDGGVSKLYLGKLYAGQSITITFVVHSDTFVDADTCGTSPGGFNSPDQKHCFDLTGTVQLQSQTSGPVGITVFAKSLNTMPITSIPINFPIL